MDKKSTENKNKKSENEVALKDGNKQRNENGGNDAGLTACKIVDVVESYAGKVKRKEEGEEKLLEVSGDGAESSVNQREAVIDSGGHVGKKMKKKSKKRQDVNCDFGASQ